jgi:DNA primase
MAERIKSAISVRQFVSQYVELSQSGKGLCPFHDDHDPSFNVNDDENYWYCFACEEGGSIIDFWMRWQGCDFVTAINELSDILHA